MAEWLHLQLNNGTNDSGEQVIDDAVLKETHARSSFLPVYKNLEPFRQPNVPVTMDQNAYGLGWRLGTYRGSYAPRLVILPHGFPGDEVQVKTPLTKLPDMRHCNFRSHQRD